MRVLAVSLFAVVVGPSWAQQDPAALVPPHTVVYARIASLDAVLASARGAASAFGGDESMVAREAVLEMLGPLAGGGEQIDGARPIGFALVAPKGVRPAPIFFVPVKDGAKYAESLREGGPEVVVDGDYAVLALGGKYTKPTAPLALANAMPAGLVSVRVDVATAAANLGVMIQSALDVAEREMAKEMERDSPGLDGEAMAEGMMDAVKSLLASGTTLDLVLDEANGRASVVGSFAAKPGSVLDGWSSPPVDLAAFAGNLKGESALEVVSVMDWSKLWTKIEPMMTGLLEIYPASMRAPMEKLLQVYPSLYAKLGPVLVGGLDLEGGMRMDLHIAPPDAKALLAEMDAIRQRPELAELGVTMAPGKASEVGGAAVLDYVVTIDPSRLAAAAGAPVDDERSEAMARQMTQVFQAMFGSDGVPVRIVAKDGRGVLSVGKPAAEIAKALESTPGTWPEGLRDALRLVDGCNPMFVERIDMAAFVRGVAAMAPENERDAMPVPPADAKAAFVMGGGVRGTEWRAFLQFDLAGFGAMMKQMGPR